MSKIIAGDKSDFQEFPFKDEIHDMADFIVAHPEILGSEVRILTRELLVPTIAGPKRLDFLAVDMENAQVDIVELKNSPADEKVLLQTLRYANWLRNNPDTVRYRIEKLGLKNINSEDIEPDAIKIIIVAPKISNTLAELCQYITAFDFEFIRLQRFKDSHGKVYAVTDRIEVEIVEPMPTRSQEVYDMEWYKKHSVREPQIDDLNEAIKVISSICEQNSWDLKPRYVKWSVRFQTPSGRNAFYIHVRKTQNHRISFRLGEDFEISEAEIPEKHKRDYHHKKDSPLWKMKLVTSEIKKLQPLMELAYNKVI